jgi:hypothetical protein
MEDKVMAELDDPAVTGETKNLFGHGFHWVQMLGLANGFLVRLL